MYESGGGQRACWRLIGLNHPAILVFAVEGFVAAPVILDGRSKQAPRFRGTVLTELEENKENRRRRNMDAAVNLDLGKRRCSCLIKVVVYHVVVALLLFFLCTRVSKTAFTLF